VKVLSKIIISILSIISTTKHLFIDIGKFTFPFYLEILTKFLNIFMTRPIIYTTIFFSHVGGHVFIIIQIYEKSKVQFRMT